MLVISNHFLQYSILALPFLLIVAAMKDLTSYTIPNWLSLAVAITFLPAALVTGTPLFLIGLDLAVGIAALILGIAMFAMNWIGGGDAKLIAACGVWLGCSAFLPFLLWTGVAGGALAVTLLYARKLRAWLPADAPVWLTRLATPGENVPYGVAIAIGALVVFPSSPVAAAMSHGLHH